MNNDGMTKEILMTNVGKSRSDLGIIRHSYFVIPSSFVIRASSF
jgi:hypothetical protein